MESVVFNFFEVLFRMVGVLLVCGAMTGVLGDIQARAFHSKRVGLVSLHSINQQLVGRDKMCYRR